MRKVKVKPRVALREPEIVLRMSPVEAEVLYFSCGKTSEILMGVVKSVERILNNRPEIRDIDDFDRKTEKILGDIICLEAIQTNLIDQARALGWDFSEDIIES